MKKTCLIRIILLLLSCVLVLPLASCSALRAGANARRVVATAGDVEITYDELYYLANTRRDELIDFYGEGVLGDPKRLAEFETFVWSNLLGDGHAMLALAAQYGITLDDSEIRENVDSHMEEILEEVFDGDRSAYVDSLNQAYLTDEYVRMTVAVENYLGIRIIREMLKKGDIDSSDTTAMAYLMGEDFIRVRQVLIETRNYKDAASAKAKIDALHESVVTKTTPAARNDAMLNAMMFSTSLDTTGDGIYFARGEMEKNVEDAAFWLTEYYEVSDVVEVEGGYCFMMLLEKEESYIKNNFAALKNQTYLIQLNERVAKCRENMVLEKTELGESLDLLHLAAIDADAGSRVWIVVLIGAAAVVAVAVVIGGRAWAAKRFKK